MIVAPRMTSAMKLATTGATLMSGRRTGRSARDDCGSQAATAISSRATTRNSVVPVGVGGGVAANEPTWTPSSRSTCSERRSATSIAVAASTVSPADRVGRYRIADTVATATASSSTSAPTIIRASRAVSDSTLSASADPCHRVARPAHAPSTITTPSRRSLRLAPVVAERPTTATATVRSRTPPTQITFDVRSQPIGSSHTCQASAVTSTPTAVVSSVQAKRRWRSVQTSPASRTAVAAAAAASSGRGVSIPSPTPVTTAVTTVAATTIAASRTMIVPRRCIDANASGSAWRWACVRSTTCRARASRRAPLRALRVARSSTDANRSNGSTRSPGSSRSPGSPAWPPCTAAGSSVTTSGVSPAAREARRRMCSRSW
ncbi:unannotated protein [freshwater metagenome]|uniref:Unannotated protein n=1 Tax=freshwater metagenome TaxID=449393 RepID=A0A6J6FLP5_9ZZZZ